MASSFPDNIGKLILKELKGIRNDLRQEIGALRFQIAEQFRAINGPIEASPEDLKAYQKTLDKNDTDQTTRSSKGKKRKKKNSEANYGIETMVISSYQSLACDEKKTPQTINFRETSLTQLHPIKVKTEDDQTECYVTKSDERYRMDARQDDNDNVFNIVEYGNEDCRSARDSDIVVQKKNTEMEVEENNNISTTSSELCAIYNIPVATTSAWNNVQQDKLSTNIEEDIPNTIVVINAPTGTESNEARMKVPEVKRSFDCKYCSMTFNSIFSLRIHQNTHTNPDRFICTNCKKEFPTVHVLNYHINSSHINVHRCSVCGRNFRTAEKLKRHFRVHSNERPYYCGVCDKHFKRSDHLATHKKSIEHMKLISIKED